MCLSAAPGSPAWPRSSWRTVPYPRTVFPRSQLAGTPGRSKDADSPGRIAARAGAVLASRLGERHSAPAGSRRDVSMKVRVHVNLKNGVLDPQGRAIHHALEGLGFAGINDVRAGKLIELDLDDGVGDELVEAMCRKLLANTVIENFRIEREAAPGEKA